MSVSTGTLARGLARCGAEDCRLALVLGSGLSALVDELGDVHELLEEEMKELPQAAVPGHAGRLAVGTLGGERVLVQAGRAHLYEGWSAREVTRAVRAFVDAGVRGVLLTNAAGSLDSDWEPGSFVRLEDHLNLQGRPPLRRGEGQQGCPYDAALGEALERAAAAVGVELRRGVYAGLLGPAYETPAEIRMLRWMGADLVGMSTVAEAEAACAVGLRVAGLSLVTNQAAGVGPRPLSHEEVVVAGQEAARRLAKLLEAAVPELTRELGD